MPGCRVPVAAFFISDIADGIAPRLPAFLLSKTQSRPLDDDFTQESTMVFSSIPFLFYFLPLCLILYYLVPFRWKNYVLLLFSLLFYAFAASVSLRPSSTFRI